MTSEPANEADLAQPELEQQLAEARAELVELERVIEELPEILEHKFRQRVDAVVAVNRQLFDQHRHLNQQLKASLPPALMPFYLKSPQRRWLWGCMAAGGSAALLVFALQWRASIRPVTRVATSVALQPSRPQQKSLLLLRASGESWVEVQDLSTRAVLYVGLMQPGESKTVAMRSGLRIRSGRPDLLTVARDDEPPQPFGEINGLGWRVMLPAGARRAGA